MGTDIEMESDEERERKREKKKIEMGSDEEREKKREKKKIEMGSDEEREKKREKKKKERSRSKSRDREKRSKHKKHNKEKKKKHKRKDDSTADEGGGADTGNEGGETPEKGRSRSPQDEKVVKSVGKLPGLAKYDSEGEEGEIEKEKGKGGNEYQIDGNREGERKVRKRDREGEDGELEKEERKEYRRDRSRERGGNTKERKRVREVGDLEKEDWKDRGEYQRDGSRERGGKDKERKRGEDGMMNREERKEYQGDVGRQRGREDRDRGRDKERSRQRRSRSRDRNRSMDREEYKREDLVRNSSSKNGSVKEPAADEPGEIGGGKEVLSLSVEESNKLRAKLGLKPLNVSNIVVEDEDEDGSKEGTLIPGDRDKTRHLPADHWGERDQQKKVREKLSTRQDKRKMDSKLSFVKGLGESDSEEDDPHAWIKKQKKKVKEKEEAEKRAKAMEELDQEFGVQDLVESELKTQAAQHYTAKDLKGIRVEHSAEAFTEDGAILTLQDGDILSDKFENVLVNVNIVDDERHKKSIQNIKDGKEGYQAYDQEEVDELTGEVTRKGLLYQYNEEIDGSKKDSFTLESSGEYSEELCKERELAKIRKKLRDQNAVSLEMPAPQLARDFYTDQEMADKMATFKKPKKKRKVRKKMLKADDLLAMSSESALLPANFGEKMKKRAARIGDDETSLTDGRLSELDHDDLPVVPDMSGVKLDHQEDPRIALKLAIARKLKKRLVKEDSVDRVVEEVRDRSNREGTETEMNQSMVGQNMDLILDQTQEFCRGLGDGGYYEKSGLNESVDKELMEFELSLETDNKYGERMRSAVEWSKMDDSVEDETVKEKTVKRGTWEEVEEIRVEEGKWKEGTRGPRHQRKGSENTNNLGGGKEVARPVILDSEALAKTGVGAALAMAKQKGYLESEEKKTSCMGLTDLKCKKYNIEDKSRDHEEDDRKRRGGGRERASGPTSSFTEKRNYKPEVTLEYVDDGGRGMSQKEAFRFLSHKFHGKGSGKLKIEKRFNKVEHEKLMEKMSSIDTPLQTLKKQQIKTKELATPYLILSGSKNNMGGHASLKK